MSPQPLVTIVTPSFNQAQFIEETIQSVIAQDYQPIEHIIMDGGSTDGTLEILRKYQDHLIWISEPDRGQANAINKGFRHAHGTILNWLNADDLLMPEAVRKVVNFFEANPQSAFVYGDVLAIDQTGREFGLRSNVRACNFDMLVQRGDFIVQPAAFWRAELWQAVGELNESWHYVLDYEYWIRAAQHYDLVYLRESLAKERLYGSAKTFRGGMERLTELEAMPRQYGGQGIPLNFRPEASAMYLVRGWDLFWQGNRTEARANLRKGLATSRLQMKTILYLLSILFFGEAAVPGLRLISNRLRGQFVRRDG